MLNLYVSHHARRVNIQYIYHVNIKGNDGGCGGGKREEEGMLCGMIPRAIAVVMASYSALPVRMPFCMHRTPLW